MGVGLSEVADKNYWLKDAKMLHIEPRGTADG